MVAFASRPEQRVIRCRLAELADRMRAADIVRTAVIFVGPVLAADGFVDSYLYSNARMSSCSSAVISRRTRRTAAT